MGLGDGRAARRQQRRRHQRHVAARGRLPAAQAQAAQETAAPGARGRGCQDRHAGRFGRSTGSTILVF